MNKPSSYFLTIWTLSSLTYMSTVSAQSTSSSTDTLTDAIVRRVHKSALTIDPHLDILVDFNTPGNDAGTDTKGQFDLPKLERGDLDVATVALFAGTAQKTPENIASARKEVDTKLAALRRFVSQHPDRLEFAYTAADLERIPAKGKHAILLSFLNAFSLGKDIAQLPILYRDGVRVFGLTHAGNNDWADSSRPSPGFGDKPDELGGLSALGKQSVAELNKLGVIIDVSQLTPAGVFQTIQLSRAPVIASHSAVRGRVDATRNLNNDELKAIAASGGVVSIVAFSAYLHPSQEQLATYKKNVWEPFGLQPGDDAKSKLDPAAYQKFQAAYREFSSNGYKYTTLADYLDAVDYTVRLIGIDHVGLSSDFNHGGGVTGYTHVGDSPNVTRELLKRGYSEEDIRKLWGGNFLRAFRDVEATAKELQRESKLAVKQ
ncbi:membrane dipeptidase [Spirosoma sp. KCTC 42546]|uniref:dipeptidase n=1 Tax=Spirosoma sp. KCTC 42546 TaxID=2520506 RepID=UPI00115BC490|nr:dipeptidase [Spirosoma sp. KCTC 42546]QDK81085.1 membrane dipeptidase [Spirosoma sp. KCTC 42546]